MRLRKKPTLSIKRAKELIEAIESLDLRSTEIEKILKLLTPLSDLERQVPAFSPGLILYRTRICGKPTQSCDLLYPPPQCVQDFGRANLPDKPLFYCCNSREAPFYELRPKVGQTAVISCWTTTARLIARPVGYTQQTFNRLNLKGDYKMNWAGDVNQAVNEFFEKAFTRMVSQDEKHLYKLSAAIAQVHFGRRNRDPLGIMYPSIPLQANAINFALKPQYVDLNLRFVRAEFVRIDAAHDSTFDITILDVANELSTSGSIAWKGQTDLWVLRNKGDQLTFTIENGKHIARDRNGLIVDMERTVAEHIEPTVVRTKLLGIIKNSDNK